MWIVLILFILGVLVFFFGVIPLFSLSITGITGSLLSGLDTLMAYSGFVCYFLPISVLQICLTCVIGFYALEWGYYVVLYIIKIFK